VVQSRIRHLILCALLVSGSVAAALPPRKDAEPVPPAPDRWAHRAAPPSDSLIRESEIAGETRPASFEVIWEVSEYGPAAAPTEQQRQAAASLIERSYASARTHGWYDADKGAADGFVPMHHSETHWANEQYVLDDVVLDPERPEFLMYYPTPGGMALAGYMFLVNAPRARGPQLGGPLTIWHYHVWSAERCLLAGLLIVDMVQDGACSSGEPESRSPEMLHVWLIDHPQGPFGTAMGLPADVLATGLERRSRERGF